MTTLNDFIVVDDVTDNLASKHNRLLGGTIRAEFINTETITATKELTDDDCQFQVITPSGANRTVELAPEATTNHVTFVYNPDATYSVVVKDDAGTKTYVTLGEDEWAMFTPVSGEAWKLTSSFDAMRETKYKIAVTLSTNDLVVTLTHLNGDTPSADRPLWILIGTTWRKITAATSITLAAGTNWFGLGGTKFATIEQDLFLYAIWDSNSSVVAIGPARICHGRLVSDFSATSTNEKYIGNYANYTTTDNVTVIGRFAATLSAGAGYTWTIPTYTNSNLIHSPIYETRRLSWAVDWANLSGGTQAAKYQVHGNTFDADVQVVSPTISGSVTFSLPFTLDIGAGANAAPIGICNLLDSGTGTFYGSIDENSSTSSFRVRCITTSTYATLFAISATVPFTWTTNDELNFKLAALPIA